MIIFLFVILAVMFVASSVNNIIMVVNGPDYYFEKAGLTNDYFVVSTAREGRVPLREMLERERTVTSAPVCCISWTVTSKVNFPWRSREYGARLVLLDVMLPGLDGFSVCEQIRAVNDTPIFILSAKGEKDDKLKGLLLGVDDYMEKPYDIDILLAEIAGIFKRRYSQDEPVSGDLTINRAERAKFQKIEFWMDDYTDCIIKGDLERSIEVLQNIMENAVKYGDGNFVRICFSEEEDCRLVHVINSGNTLPKTELSRIFDSFWRSSNSTGKSGSGLGLFICRRLMAGMSGDIFAEINGDEMCVTVVFVCAENGTVL